MYKLRPRYRVHIAVCCMVWKTFPDLISFLFFFFLLNCFLTRFYQACPKYLWVTWNEYKLKLSCYTSEYVKVVSRVWQKWAMEILFPPLVPSCTLWGLMSTCGLLTLYTQPPPPSLHLFWPKHVHTGNKSILVVQGVPWENKPRK